MKKNLFIVTENEKERILNMHKNAAKNLYLFEQAVDPVVTTTKRYDNPGLGKTLKIQMKINDECPMNILGKKLVEDGKDGTLTFSAFERCKGSFVKVVKATDAVDVNTTFLVNNEKITYPRKNAEGMEETVESQAKAGILNGETKVWSPTLKDDKGQKLSWTKIKELPPNSVLAKQLNLIMSTIAPDDIAPTVVTTYDISVDGIAAPINYTKETLTKAIADGNGTLNKETASFVFIDPITQAKSYKKVMENSELLKIFNSASGVQPITAERKSTGIPELDVWLKGEIGSGWDKLTDPKQKESMYDSFEKTDPTIKKLTDQYKKQKIRSALGMSADTGLGRGLQNLRGKVGAAITGNQPQV